MSRDVHPLPGATPIDGTAPAFPDDAVEVSRVLGAWGVKGAIKVKPFAADPQALFSSKRWFLRPSELPRPAPPPAAAAKTPVLPTLLRVRQAREQGDTVVATCDDLDDRDAAEALKGARVFVARSSFPTAGTDEYYWVDLIGCAVRNREGVDLGTVTGLIETGPHCVLSVAPGAAATAAAGVTAAPAARAEMAQRAGPADELLIPFVAAYVDRVDLAARCVHVDWQADY